MKPAISIFAAALLGIFAVYPIFVASDHEVSSPTAAKIKARFSLVDHHGRTVTEQTYRVKWLLMFFGYTSCPDICPMTLYDVALTLKALDDDADRVQAIFVSVDPERDTVDVLARYIPSFGPSIIGLTGKPEMIKQAAQALRVHNEKVVSPNVAGSYSVDYQSYLYLIRPDGEFETVFPHGMAVDRMVKALRRHITLLD